MDGRKITEGDVTKAGIVRVAVIAQLYKTLTLVFHAKHNLTLLSIWIVSNEVNKTKIDIRFNITVDTFTPLPAVPTVAPTSTLLANGTVGNETMQNGTKKMSLWEEDIPMPKQPAAELFNSLDYVVPLFRNGTILPADVLSQLAALRHEYKIGDLTEKGYYRRKAKILRQFVEQNESFGQMVFGSELPRLAPMAVVGNANSSEQLTVAKENKSEDNSKKGEEKVTQKGGNKTSAEWKGPSRTVPREGIMRRILWISEQDSSADEVIFL